MSFRVKTPFKPKIIKNAPKSFFKAKPERAEAATPPNTAKITAGIITAAVPEPIKFCFLWTETVKAAIGKKAMRFAACATCCSTPANRVKTGIKTVPPPIPIPPKSPDKNPAAR